VTAEAISKTKVGWSDTHAKLIIYQETIKSAVCVLRANIA
jgi:hypothetical protein